MVLQSTRSTRMQNGGATRELKLTTLDHLPKETMHGCDRPTLVDMGDKIRQKNLCGTRRLTVLAVGVNQRHLLAYHAPTQSRSCHRLSVGREHLFVVVIGGRNGGRFRHRR